MATAKKSTLTKTWEKFESNVQDIHLHVGIAVAIALAAFFVQSALTYWNVTRGIILLFGILGYVGVWWFGIRPTNLKAAGIGGFFYGLLNDTDKSQGAVKGFKFLARLVQDIAWAYLTASFFMATWPFGLGIFLSWLILAGVLILSQMGASKWWRAFIVTTYVAGVLIYGLWSTSGVYAGKAFNPKTGEALYMVDPLTGRIDTLGRSPADCKGNLVKEPTTQPVCFSTESGVKLEAITPEQALKRNPIALGDQTIEGLRNGSKDESEPTTDSSSSIGECKHYEAVRLEYGLCFVIKPNDKILIDGSNQPDRFTIRPADAYVDIEEATNWSMSPRGLIFEADKGKFGDKPMVVFVALKTDPRVGKEADAFRNKIRIKAGLDSEQSAFALAVDDAVNEVKITQ